MLMLLALMTLLMVPVDSNVSNTDEWKSLSNPQSRTLILQSYLEGKESEAQAMGRKANVKENRKSNMANTDKYNIFLHNDIYDV